MVLNWHQTAEDIRVFCVIRRHHFGWTVAGFHKSIGAVRIFARRRSSNGTRRPDIGDDKNKIYQVLVIPL